MKIGICAGFTIEGDELFIPHLKFYKQSGFDYLELALSAVADITQEQFDSLVCYLKRQEVAVPVCNMFFPAGYRLCGEGFSLDVIEEYLKVALPRAKCIGTKILVLGSGNARSIPPGFDSDTALSQLDSVLSLVHRHCESLGLILAPEHLSRLECNTLTTFEQTAKTAERFASPHFMAMLDSYHFNLGNESGELVKKYSNYIVHVHCARTLGRAFPTVADLPTIYEELAPIKQIGYNERITFECRFEDRQDEPDYYREVVCAMKNHFK